MKTKKQKHLLNRSINKIKSCIVIILFLLSHQQSVSQQIINNKGIIGVVFGSELCSNGYGTQYMPSLFYKVGRRSFLIAPTIQKKEFKISGLQLKCEYSLTGSSVSNNDCRTELFVFIDAAYHKNARMGKFTQLAEKKTNPLYEEEKMDELRFTSIEAYAGFGLRIPFLKRFKWINSIGFGGYNSIDFPDKCYYYESRNIGLLLNTGISMEIKKL